MPADRTQIANERIDALVEMLEAEGVIPTEHADELKNANGIGRAAEVAQAHARGTDAGGQP